MKVCEVYDACQNIEPGAVFKVYKSMNDYVGRKNPEYVFEIFGATPEEKNLEIIRFMIVDGFIVHCLKRGVI